MKQLLRNKILSEMRCDLSAHHSFKKIGILMIGLFAICAVQAAQRPNVIVIMADDLGYADVGFNGGKMAKTPHLDLLAKGGLQFSDAHVSASVCSPSRAGFITGRYQQRFGHEANCPWGKHGMDLKERTIGQAFRDIGYRTGIFGKWHLGSTDAQYPTARGFDVFCGMREGSRNYWYNTKKSDRKGDPHAAEVNGKQVAFKGHFTDWIGQKGIGFMRESVAQKKPFFAFFSFNAPHMPIEPKPEDVSALNFPPNTKRANYYGLIYGLDRNAGLIIDELKKLGILENTMIWFLSDNGGTPIADNSPLAGIKGIKLEGGQRVPFVLSWAGHTHPGTVYSNMVSSLDIFPTSIAACGGNLKQERPLDGVNIMPYLEGTAKGVPHKRLFWRKEEGAAVRDGDWKLIRTEGIPPMLYNVKKDLSEENNLAEKEPERVKNMLEMLSEWEKDLVKPLWSEGKYWAKVRKGDYMRHLKRTSKKQNQK